MGLDMYAYAVDEGDVAIVHGNGHVELKEGVEPVRLAYWRKHNALHGWMTRLYLERNELADEDSFNCQSLALSEEDIDALERDVLGNNLPHTTGFFFGADTSVDNPHYEDDVAFIRNAREAMKAGKVVYYDSWW